MYFSVLKTFLLISLMFFTVDTRSNNAPLQVPTQHAEWLYQDLQRFLPDHQIQTLQTAQEQAFIALVKEQTTGIPKGVAFLIPDFSQGILKQAALSNLYQTLNDYGWTNVLLTTPHYEDIQQANIVLSDESAQSSVDSAQTVTGESQPAAPSDTSSEGPSEQIQKVSSQNLALTTQTMGQIALDLQQRVAAAVEFAGQFPGFYLMVCEGKSCPLLVDLIAEQKVPRPDALVMLSGHALGQTANRNFAEAISLTDFPVLDLRQAWDNRWLEDSFEWRRKVARKNFKTDFRQRKLNSYYDYYGQERRVVKEIYGFLHTVGM